MRNKQRWRIGEAFERLSESVTEWTGGTSGYTCDSLKLNEIVAAINGASNRLIEAEGLTEKELTALRRHYKELATLAAREADSTKSHSVEEAKTRIGASGLCRG